VEKGSSPLKRTLFSLLAALPLFVPLKSGASTRLGQWVWSSRDKALYEEGLKTLPDLKAAVWVGTIFWKDGRFSRKLALPPFSRDSAAVVIRLDDSVHGAWTEASLRTEEDLDETIRDILKHVEGAGASPKTVQLDYDCPVARLRQWSEAVKVLKQGSLHDAAVWIATLISHMEYPEFGKLFGDLVAGHVLQVFDTGDAYADGRSASLVGELERQGIPFQMGFGAFERKSREGAVTRHRDWLKDLPVFSKSPLYRGAWIFPAGLPWIANIKEVL
jgi:hypothetical protein